MPWKCFSANFQLMYWPFRTDFVHFRSLLLLISPDHSIWSIRSPNQTNPISPITRSDASLPSNPSRPPSRPPSPAGVPLLSLSLSSLSLLFHFLPNRNWDGCETGICAPKRKGVSGTESKGQRDWFDIKGFRAISRSKMKIKTRIRVRPFDFL